MWRRSSIIQLIPNTNLFINIMSKPEIIDPKKRVKVYATDKAALFTKGDPIIAGEQMAKKLIAAGKATLEEPKEENPKSPFQK